METNNQDNISNILGKFNEQMTTALNEVQESLREDLRTQINKAEFMCKLNRAGSESLYCRDNSNSVPKKCPYLFKCITINFREGEYITSCEEDVSISGITCGNRIHDFLIVITNYGSIFIRCMTRTKRTSWTDNKGYYPYDDSKQNMLFSLDYYGKEKVDDDILYIFNEMIRAMQPHISRDDMLMHNYGNHNPKVFQIRYLKKYELLINLMKTYQDNHVKPLIEYNAQKIIDEKEDLKKRRDEINKIKVEQELKRIRLLDKEKQIAKDLDIYKNIKNLEEKFNEIKKYKAELDKYAKHLEDDRRQLEEDKKELEILKNSVKSHSFSMDSNGSE